MATVKVLIQTIIELMAIGERMISSNPISYYGKQIGGCEHAWDFDDSEWTEIAPENLFFLGKNWWKIIRRFWSDNLR